MVKIMFAKELNDYLQNRLIQIKDYFFLALQKYDPEAIHELRVAIKHLKAFYNLLESIDPEFKGRKKFRAFKEISVNTRTLRDIQVQRDLIKKIKTVLQLSIRDYEIYLKKKEQEEYGKFRDSTEGKPVKKSLKSYKVTPKGFENFSPDLVVEKARTHLEAQRIELIQLVKKNEPSETVLHNIRILSKEMHFTMEIVKQCFDLLQDRSVFIKEIKKLHQLIGKWHDYDVSLICLSDFFKSRHPDLPSPNYAKLREHLLKEKEKLSRKLPKVIEKFIQSAQPF